MQSSWPLPLICSHRSTSPSPEKSNLGQRRGSSPVELDGGAGAARTSYPSVEGSIAGDLRRASRAAASEHCEEEPARRKMSVRGLNVMSGIFQGDFRKFDRVTSFSGRREHVSRLCLCHAPRSLFAFPVSLRPPFPGHRCGRIRTHCDCIERERKGLCHGIRPALLARFLHGPGRSVSNRENVSFCAEFFFDRHFIPHWHRSGLHIL